MTEQQDKTSTEDGAAVMEFQLRHGDAIHFPLTKITSGRTPLLTRLEVEIVTGTSGERLGLQQAKIFQEIQEYLISRHPHPDQEPSDAPAE